MYVVVITETFIDNTGNKNNTWNVTVDCYFPVKKLKLITKSNPTITQHSQHVKQSTQWTGLHLHMPICLVCKA